GTGGGGAGGPGPAQHGECAPGGTGGAGATATTAGTGGDAFYVTVHHSGDGSFGSGGTAIGSILDDAVGGGGGGGWFGGGAGGGLYQAFAGSGGGGGGGSDYVTPAARDVAVADGVTTGAASVTITPIAGATVSFTSVYNRGEAFRLHQYASRTNRSDAQTQHDATVSLATLLDRLLSGNDGRRHGRDGLRTKQHDTSARRGGVSVTSVYSTADAALVSKVARVLGLSEPAFQKFAVMMLSRSPDHG
ncbi:MAG: hypothetical protein JOZ99_11295, partial [Actinobacteria bacterium]|nr:hypothetical protein [Actinomycetota bacterium]